MKVSWTQVLDQRVFIVLAIVVVALSVFVPGFTSGANVQNVLVRAAPDGLMAVGMTLVILAGQLDLSIGSTFALAGIIAISLEPSLGTIPAVVMGVAVGPVVGLANGLLVSRLQLNSFIATLGMMIGVRGLAYVLSIGPVSGIDLNAGGVVTANVLGPITVQSGIFLVAMLVAAFVLTRTKVGRNLYAVGGNPESSRLAGIDPRPYVLGVYVVSGLAASLAGVQIALSLNTGSPVYGQSAVITVIAAVVLGGTSLKGGEGGILRTLGGILIWESLGAGLDRINVPAYYQSIVTGLLLIVVVLVDSVITQRRQQAAVRRPRSRLSASTA